MPTLISALVLNYRSPQETAKCVLALKNQTIADALEIIIIDNHSDDESTPMLRARFRSDRAVKIIESRTNCGYGQGNNMGERFATGEYLLIINPDNPLPPEALAQMLAVLKAHPQAGIVGPALVHPDGSIRPSARPFPRWKDLITKRLQSTKWHAEHNASIDTASSTPITVDWLVGACLLMKTSLFEELGGFDPRFFLFFEDIDLCRRCTNLGKSVLYAPFIRVPDRRQRLSEGGILSLLMKKTTRIHLQSALKYFWKWRKA
ncbi:MAG: glycosyltransferase family 2 protein [Candidatus Peribacteraceae bacterium]|nr:glycosyltransferase family 2 protein [Candidatus Peribacteraceae bacterium]